MQENILKGLDKKSIELAYDLLREPLSQEQVVSRYNGSSEAALCELKSIGALHNISRTGEPVYALRRNAKQWVYELTLERFTESQKMAG